MDCGLLCESQIWHPSPHSALPGHRSKVRRMLFEKQLQSLVATFYCPMGGEQHCGWLLGHRKTPWPLSHHVVVVVPLNDVGWWEQLLLDGGGRGRGRLHPGLEQVRHVVHLANTKKRSPVRKRGRPKRSRRRKWGWDQITKTKCWDGYVDMCLSMENHKLTAAICIFHVAPCYQSKRTTVPLCLLSGKNYCHISNIHIFVHNWCYSASNKVNSDLLKKNSLCWKQSDKSWQVWEHASILRWCFCRGAVRWQSVFVRVALLHNERHSLTHSNTE